jgi:hypothetical protein
MIGWVPSTWRRPLIDSVYGAEDEKGLRIYLGVLWAATLLTALILGGFTPGIGSRSGKAVWNRWSR